jgi:hypothetical protein
METLRIMFDTLKTIQLRNKKISKIRNTASDTHTE